MITIWHNPRCSKSRQTLGMLEENGHAPAIRRYLEDAPTEKEIRHVLTALDLPAIAMMRTGEAAFRELGLSKTDSDDQLITAMASDPRLIERPIVISDSRAAIGRPPEAVLTLF